MGISVTRSRDSSPPESPDSLPRWLQSRPGGRCWRRSRCCGRQGWRRACCRLRNHGRRAGFLLLPERAGRPAGSARPRMVTPACFRHGMPLSPGHDQRGFWAETRIDHQAKCPGAFHRPGAELSRVQGALIVRWVLPIMAGQRSERTSGLKPLKSDCPSRNSTNGGDDFESKRECMARNSGSDHCCLIHSKHRLHSPRVEIKGVSHGALGGYR